MLARRRFSALQRAENSSIAKLRLPATPVLTVSVLFSEPKIPQQRWGANRHHRDIVSVLFSEPKIPQYRRDAVIRALMDTFQCSSASRKFLNGERGLFVVRHNNVSVLFSEPKIPQPEEFAAYLGIEPGFSALQRAENSSTERKSRSPSSPLGVSVLFSEPKIPQRVCRT